MTREWIIEPTLSPQKMILNGYQWNDDGFTILFEDAIDDRTVQISFSTDIDGVKLVFLKNDLEVQNKIYELMLEAGVSGSACVSAFVQDSSDFIDEVKKMDGYDAVGKTYLHYTIITDDFWINIVSIKAPHIIVTNKD